MRPTNNIVFPSISREENEKKHDLNLHFFDFQCQNGGCLIELAQQLAVIMIGKQIINNCQEVIVP